MLLHTVKDELTWEEVTHHVLNRVNTQVANVLHAEILYFKNDEVSLRSTIKIQELVNAENSFSLSISNYAHVSPDILRLEFNESKHIGDYATLEEAKIAAQTYYNHHHHAKYHHSH